MMIQRHLFNGHFPEQPDLAGPRMSQFWILLELRMTEVVLTTGASRCAKLQSNYHHQQSNTYARCPSCHPTNSFSASKINCRNHISNSQRFFYGRLSESGLTSQPGWLAWLAGWLVRPVPDSLPYWSLFLSSNQQC